MTSEPADCRKTENAEDLNGEDTERAAPCQLETMKQSAEEFVASFNALLNENVLARRQLDERALRIAELDEVLTQTSARLHEEVEKRKQAEQAHAEELDALNKQLQELSAERDRLGSENEAVSGELENVRQGLSGLERQLHETTQREECASSRLAEREAEIGTLNGTLAELRQEAEQRGQESAEQLQELQKRLENLQSTEETCRELEKHARNLENLNKALHESSVSEQERNRKVIELRDREIETLRAETEASAAAQKRADGLACEVQSLQEQLEAAGKQLGEIDGLTDRLRDTEQKLAELTAVNEENGQQHTAGMSAAADQSGIAEQVARNEKLADELKKLKKKMSGYSDIWQELAALERENNRLKSRLQQGAESGTELQDAQQEIERLREELALAREQLDGQSVATQGRSQDAAPAAVDSGDGQATQAFTGHDVFMSSLAGRLSSPQKDTDTIAVACVTVDGFSKLRNENGASVCDQFIAGVHGLLDSFCSGTEMVARIDECSFAMLLSGDDAQTLVERAGRMRDAIENRIFDCGGSSVVTTASFGLVPDLAENDRPDAVMARAEHACQSAQSGGGNSVVVEHLGEDAGDPARDGNEAEIVRSILGEGRLKTYYQPISSLRGNTAGCYEVLVRVLDEHGNVTTPAEFLDMAERAGVCHEVDMHVIESAIRVMTAEEQDTTSLFIKLAPQTVARTDLVQFVGKLVAESRLDPGRLVLEITESNIKSDLKAVSGLTRALQALGCKVAIEHFALETQVQHLKHIHVDYLKIDAGLVQNIGDDEQSKSRVKSIIDIARSINCNTIAEKIESPYVLTQLWSLGVDYAQGYFIQEPDAERGYDFGGGDSGDDRSADGGKSVFIVQ